MSNTTLFTEQKNIKKTRGQKNKKTKNKQNRKKTKKGKTKKNKERKKDKPYVYEDCRSQDLQHPSSSIHIGTVKKKPPISLISSTQMK